LKKKMELKTGELQCRIKESLWVQSNFEQKLHLVMLREDGAPASKKKNQKKVKREQFKGKVSCPEPIK